MALLPVFCNSTRQPVGAYWGRRHRTQVCTTSATSGRRRRRAEILKEEADPYSTNSRGKRFVEDPKFDVFLNPTKKEKQEEVVNKLTKKFKKVRTMQS